MATVSATQIYQSVQDHYGSCARAPAISTSHSEQVAKAFGYAQEELVQLPEGANLGLSCGNPLAIAGLRSGETVVDLGSGAGFDVFLAAKRVGDTGRAIGVDMNKDMLERARKNKDKSGASNTLFVESPITKIALESSTVDCIISNCVVNLVPENEKQLVFDEMFRLLKPGGRVAISDILVKKELRPEMKKDMGLYVGCIAGASEVGQYEQYLHKAGFKDTLIVDSKNDLNVYKGISDDSQEVSCCGTTKPKKKEAPSCCGTKVAPPESSCCSTADPETGVDPSILSSDYKDVDFNEWAGSFQVYAVKP